MYKKKGHTLPDDQYLTFEKKLEALDAAYLRGDQPEASRLAHWIEEFTSTHFKKTYGQYALEIITALILALAIATVVRQSWFELYEIPTGSMRPTFKEQDHLTVSKTQFGINIPLKTGHFFFEPEEVKRAGIVIWSGDGVALRDTDTKYFGILPYKKRYIKRLMGKPGDVLYFYGGKIYGIDQDSKQIDHLIQDPHLEKLEYIPFLTFEGEITSPSRGIIQFEQMHQAIGRLRVGKSGSTVSEIFNGKEWVQDEPSAFKTPHNRIKSYSDFWGIGNFAMARLLTPSELKAHPDLKTDELEEGLLYLELIHHPSLTYPKPIQMRGSLSVQTMLNPHRSILPVREKHLKALMENMYTARFEIKDHLARRYSIPEVPYSSTSPRFPNVNNGTYEFYYGSAYSIGWGGTPARLPKEHSIYQQDASNLQNLFNYGIDLNTYYQPLSYNTLLFPHRYAYYRNGDLYLMGAPIYTKDDPLLKSFLENEEKKESQSTEKRPYLAFKDKGPPVNAEGHFDTDFIRAFGLKLSSKQYLVLGDNHAMSADSRIFGFLPEENLQGVPSIVLWPLNHFGPPNQKPYHLFTSSRLIIWSIVLLLALIWILYRRYRLRQSVFKKA